MSPFDEARYARLLEGLEAVEILFSEFLIDNLYARLDSEFQSKERKAVVSKLRSAGAVRFGESAPEITHPHEITRSYVDEGGVWFFRAQNNRPMMIDSSNKVFLSDSDADSLPKNELQNGDVVITRTGANAGDCALFTETKRAIASSHTFLVRSQYWRHPYLVAFFNSRFGRLQITSSLYGAAQPEVAPYYLRNIWIPSFSFEFYHKVERCFEEATEKVTTATKYLANSETTLLHALGLDDWQAPDPLTYIRSSGDTFVAGRFDAEYFHPAKAEALARLNVLSDCTVGDQFNSIRELWQPNDESSPDVVRNYDLTDALNPFLDGSKEPSDRATIASTKKVICSGDLVVSRLRSYLKEIALVQPGGKIPMVASTEFIVLRPKQPNTLPPEALMIFLRSELPQTIFKWSQDGSNHPRFDEKELLRLPLPRVLIQQASEYVAAVRSVVAKQERASQLLEVAKRAVEIAIEESESAALAWFSAHVEECSQQASIG